MTAFNDVFYSLLCSKIQNVPQNRPESHRGSSRSRKTLNLAPYNSQKYAISRSQDKKNLPLHKPLSRWGGEHSRSVFRPPTWTTLYTRPEVCVHVSCISCASTVACLLNKLSLCIAFTLYVCHLY